MCPTYTKAPILNIASPSNTLTISSRNDGTTPNNTWFISSSISWIGDNSGVVGYFTGGTSGIPANSFELETLAWGAQMNNEGGTVVDGALPSGSAVNVRWEVNQCNYEQGTFTLLVRSGNDNQAQKNVLETWTNLSMDVNQPNYIARVIGNTKPVYTYSTADGQGYVDYVGDFPNQSRYIRVADVPFYDDKEEKALAKMPKSPGTPKERNVVITTHTGNERMPAGLSRRFTRKQKYNLMRAAGIGGTKPASEEGLGNKSEEHTSELQSH